MKCLDQDELPEPLSLCDCIVLDGAVIVHLQLEGVYPGKRGKGVRRKVSGHVKFPSNWMDFLHDCNNKNELFAFLTSKVANFDFPQNKAVYVSYIWSVCTFYHVQTMMNCNREEADTRIIVHTLHALCLSKSILLTKMSPSSLLVHSLSYFRFNLW